jgi:hypothetical protein
MSTYYLQTEDNSVQYLETYETIKDAVEKAKILCKQINMPISIKKSLLYPPQRETAFWRYTFFPNGDIKYDDLDIVKAINQVFEAHGINIPK